MTDDCLLAFNYKSKGRGNKKEQRKGKQLLTLRISVVCFIWKNCSLHDFEAHWIELAGAGIIAVTMDGFSHKS